MYEEKKAFPIKWIIIGVSVFFILIITIVILSNGSDTEKLYKDKISEIEKAAIAYGLDNEEELKALENACISIEQLIASGLLESDSKSENVIYDPRSKNKTLEDEVYLTYDDGDVYSEYKLGEVCSVDYKDKIFVEEVHKTSSSISLKISVPSLLIIDKIEITPVDEEEFFKLDGDTQDFSELEAGMHTIKVKVTAINSKGKKVTYDVLKEFTIEEIVKPKIELDEETKIVTITYPESPQDYNYNYYYLLNSEDESLKEATDKTTYTYEFKETGYIIAYVSDGINTVKTEKLEVEVKPVCEDTEWSTCAGCSAVCGETCVGSQTSNCGNTRECTMNGQCETVKRYKLTVKASYGSPGSFTTEVLSGTTQKVEVKPNSGYVYSSVKCDNGTASYASSSNTLTISNITTDRTCTITFKKSSGTDSGSSTPIPTYVVTFKSGITGATISTKEVKKGSAVSSVSAPAVSGYTFASWTLNGANYDFSSSVNSNITLVAKYNANKIAVTFNANGGTPSKTVDVIPGYSVSAYTPINIGYHFLYWTLNGAQYNFSSPVNSPITLIASWAPTKTENVTMACTGEPCTKTFSLRNFNGIHNVSTNSGKVTYTLNGSQITISITGTSSCIVSVTYY